MPDTIREPIECETCHGSGFVPDREWQADLASTRPNYHREKRTCPECHGVGSI